MLKTIYILWLRQIKRYLRSPARIVGSLGQPLLFLVALGFGLGPVFQKAGGGNYLQFLAPGVIAMSVLFTSLFAGIEIIWDKQFGFLKETLVSPVSRFSIMVGRTMGGATVATLQGVVVLVLSFLVGFRPVSFTFGNIVLALVFMFLIALLFTSLGTGIASLLDDMQGFQLIMNFLVMPIFFLSGALFPLAGVPSFIQAVAYVDPLTYGVDALRHVLSSGAFFPLATSTAVLVGSVAVLLGIGSYLFSKIQV